MMAGKTYGAMWARAAALLRRSGSGQDHRHPQSVSPFRPARRSTESGCRGCSGAGPAHQGSRERWTPPAERVSDSHLKVGTYSFPGTMYGNIAGDYSTAEDALVPWRPGTVSRGANAWYRKF